VFQTSSVQVSHPQSGETGAGSGSWAFVGADVGADVGSDVGETVGEADGEFVGEFVGEIVGAEVSSSSSHWQVQISGNSSLTKRQAPASSNGPLSMPTFCRVATSESRTNEIRSPQVYPSTRVFQTSSVQLSHPQRGEDGVGAGSCTGEGVIRTGAGVGGRGTTGPSLSVLKIVLTSYVL